MNVSYKNIQIDVLCSNTDWIDRDFGRSFSVYFSPVLKCCFSFCNDLWPKKFVETSWVLSLHYCHGNKIKYLNKTYRNKDKLTDVLSFPIYDNLRKSWDIVPGPRINLGDIFICRAAMKNQAPQWNHSFHEEFDRLFIHGFLHILGFDHELNGREAKLMNQLESQILCSIQEIRIKTKTCGT